MCQVVHLHNGVPSYQHFMRRHQVNLTEEEKETLKAEGLPIPTTLPLTKVMGVVLCLDRITTDTCMFAY